MYSLQLKKRMQCCQNCVHAYAKHKIEEYNKLLFQVSN